MMAINGLILASTEKKNFIIVVVCLLFVLVPLKKTFVTDGFSDWNHTTHRFKLHQSITCHKSAMQHSFFKEQSSRQKLIIQI